MSAHKGRLNVPIPDHAAKAGVLVLLYPIESKVHTVLIQRVSHQKDKHSGQISFPGGRLESTDTNLEHCALRETHEEIGLKPDKIQVLGKLTSLYIPVSNFLVQPFVAMMKSPPQFIPEVNEVASIIPVELDRFFHKEVVKKRDMLVDSGIRLIDVPYYDLKPNVVWGATAMIMSELIELLRNPKDPRSPS